MRWWLAIALSGCNPPDSSDPDDSGGPPDNPDPIAAARAGCTSTATGTESGAPYAVEVSIYDDNGDRVSAEITYEDGGHALRTWEYGNPHEPAVFRDDGDGVADDLERFDTWEDGNVVRLEFDYGIDGTVDEIEILTYGDDHLMDSQDWDYDADGVLDDESDYTWEPDGDGWHAVGEGVDPYGTYDTEEWADAEAFVYHYTYLDDRGLSGEWELSPRNALGLSARFETRTTQPGTYSYEQVEDTTFDELGRHLELRRVTDETIGSDPPTHRDQLWVYAFDCP